MGLVHSRIYRFHNDQRQKRERSEAKLRRTKSENILRELSVTDAAIGGDARFPSFNDVGGATVDTTTGTVHKSIIGREFKAHGNPKYMLPGDDEELDRLLIQHYAVRFMFQGNFRANIQDGLDRGIKVLDVGCGPGSWTLEMATDYPNSLFIGTDLADVYPSAITPRNCEFVKANTITGLPFQDNTFDYVYQRCMLLSFPEKEWPGVIKELTRVTKPGGFIEIVECDLLIHDAGPLTAEWNEKLFSAMRTRGIDFTLAQRMHGLLKAEKNLTTPKKLYYSAPMDWGDAEFGRLGELLRQNIEMAFRSLKPMLVLAGAYEDTEYDDMTNKAMKEFREYRSWVNFFAHWAQKPLKPQQ